MNLLNVKKQVPQAAFNKIKRLLGLSKTEIAEETKPKTK